MVSGDPRGGLCVICGVRIKPYQNKVQRGEQLGCVDCAGTAGYSNLSHDMKVLAGPLAGFSYYSDG